MKPQHKHLHFHASILRGQGVLEPWSGRLLALEMLYLGHNLCRSKLTAPE